MHDALIRHWLHQEPANDLDRWVVQVADALNLEERNAENMARAVARAFGGKG